MASRLPFITEEFGGRANPPAVTAKIAAHLILGPREEPFLGALLTSIGGAVQTLIVNDNSPGPSPHQAALESSPFGRDGPPHRGPNPIRRISPPPATSACGSTKLRTPAIGSHSSMPTKCTRRRSTTIAANLEKLPADYDFVDGYTWHFFQSFDYYTSIERRMMFFRYKPGIRWEGAVHERLIGLDGKRIALPYVYAHYGHTLAPRRHAEKGRHYSSLGAPGGVLREDQLDDFDVAAYFAPEYPRLLRFRAAHPPAANATLEALRPQLSPFHALTDRIVRAQPPAIAAKNAVRRANYELRWRGTPLFSPGSNLNKNLDQPPGTTDGLVAYREYMRTARTLSYALLSIAATAAIVACAGRSGPLPAGPRASNRTASERPLRFQPAIWANAHPAIPSTVVIALRFNNETELGRLADDVSNPNSARFRHFLKPSEFASRFSPTVAQHARVVE